MRDARKRLTSVLSATAIVGAGVLAAQPAQAEPDIDQVKDRVDRLYHEAEQASERYNDLQIELKELRSDLKSLRADEKRQAARVKLAQMQVEDSVIAQFQGEGAATLGVIVVSDDPAAFLADLNALSSYNDLQSQQYADFATEAEALSIRADETRERVDEVAEAEQEAETAKDQIDDRLAKAKDILADLKAEERAELERQQQTVSRSSDPAPVVDVPASGRAGAAVQYALAQVGDAYVYGAMGESAFDCSGLTMRAWAQAGVSLPHSSSAQMGSGARVSSSALQPGDLVFYYSPISHVGMYIGGGMIVHAANPSTGVQVAGVFSMPLLRRGPPWLIVTNRRPVAHAGGWPAFRRSWSSHCWSPGCWSGTGARRPTCPVDRNAHGLLRGGRSPAGPRAGLA